MKEGNEKKWKEEGNRRKRTDKTLIISVSLQFCLSFFLLWWIGDSNVVESGAGCTILVTE